jgi:hypothetical protein
MNLEKLIYIYTAYVHKFNTENNVAKMIKYLKKYNEP